MEINAKISPTCTLSPAQIAAHLIYQAEHKNEEWEDIPMRYGITSATCKEQYKNFDDGEVKIYSSDVFKKIRGYADISDELYSTCLSPEHLQCFTGPTDSKSGEAFWRSNDPCTTIVVKTVKHAEAKIMWKISEAYGDHIESNPHSCISGILGLYRIRLKKSSKKLYFIVMRNVFSTVATVTASAKNTASMRFDLKGSTVGRKKAPSSNVLKDLDLKDMYKQQREREANGQVQKLDVGVQLLHLGPSVKSTIVETVKHDAQFLKNFKLMDYSLLVQIEHKNTIAEELSSTKYKRWNVGPAKRWSSLRVKMKALSLIGTSNAAPSESLHGDDVGQDINIDIPKDKGKLVAETINGHVIHLGIVDFLQRYTVRKHLETFFKGFLYDSTKISCVHPDRYASRITQAVDEYFT